MNFPEILGQALLGWLLADLMIGLFHWWEDRIGREDMPLMGSTIRANRLHHAQPLAFANGSVLYRHGHTWAATAAIGGLWLLLFGASVTLAVTVLGGLVVNEVHLLTHKPKQANRLVRILQGTGLIQSPKHHAGHHRPPSDRRYCVLTDWLNPVLDELKVWDRLERLFGRRDELRAT